LRVDFNNKPKEGITILIALELNGVPSVHRALSQIEETIRAEMENVFAWKKFKFDFQVQGVSVDPKKKYFASPEKKEAASLTPPSVEEKPLVPGESVNPVEIAPLSRNKAEELTVEKEDLEDVPPEEPEEEEQLIDNSNKKASKKPSILSKMLWGK
jgi:hypothetical protein